MILDYYQDYKIVNCKLTDENGVVELAYIPEKFANKNATIFVKDKKVIVSEVYSDTITSYRKFISKQGDLRKAEKGNEYLDLEKGPRSCCENDFW